MSSAVECNGMVFLAGLIADDTSKGVRAQTEQVLSKIDALLTACGTNKSRLLSAVIYLDDIRDKEEINKAWLSWMDPSHPPARACVQASLATPATLVEIMVVAAK
ncbi:MAG: RidA family protein [Rhodospirillales bacterium]|nr:RidA family protein [Rhodospirillales bacterium]